MLNFNLLLFSNTLVVFDLKAYRARANSELTRSEWNVRCTYFTVAIPSTILFTGNLPTKIPTHNDGAHSECDTEVWYSQTVKNAWYFLNLLRKEFHLKQFPSPCKQNSTPHDITMLVFRFCSCLFRIIITCNECEWKEFI